MATSKRYPLELLLRQREEAVDERVRVLLERVEAVREAEVVRGLAVRDRLEHEEISVRQKRVEVDRLVAGEAVVGDLGCLDAWRVVQAERALQLVRAEEEAVGRECRARQREDDARGALADARAGVRVMERHRDRFWMEERRAEELRVESEVEDVVNARCVAGLRRTV